MSGIQKDKKDCEIAESEIEDVNNEDWGNCEEDIDEDVAKVMEDGHDIIDEEPSDAKIDERYTQEGQDTAKSVFSSRQ